MKKKLIIGASIGNCVHVAGVIHFLSLAEDEGYETKFLGPAVPLDVIFQTVETLKPDYVALGYRLTPENVVPLAQELAYEVPRLKHTAVWIFGGTAPVAREVERYCVFDKIFDSTEDIDDCIAFLRGSKGENVNDFYPQRLVDRIAVKYPYPLLRHHFGLPSYKQTLDGVREIALSKTIDVISLGIDQNTQEHYFDRANSKPEYDGAGGVPIKNDGQFAALLENSRCGNFPMLRCYSGTAYVQKLAEVLERTINNAWCAVPLCWYNELDGRGPRTLETSIADAHALIRYHAERGIPVELNEPHHWGLRDAHDTISVAMSYISALNAKKCGVQDYVAQYMFNVPNAMSFSMDLAKVCAQIELTESLADDTFHVYRQTRTGLALLSGDTSVAKGQLASSTALQMAVQPHIIHVVGYSEGEFAATPEVVIESAKIVRGVIRTVLSGAPDQTRDERVSARKRELIDEAMYLVDYIRERYKSVSDDPLCDPAVLADCVRRGILDAPHILKNDKFRGTLKTRMLEGCCLAVDEQGKPMSEKQRLAALEACWTDHHSA